MYNYISYFIIVSLQTLTLIFQQLTLFVSFLFVGQIEGEGSLNLDAVG